MRRDARADLLRVLTAIAVVGIHAISFMDYMPIDQMDWHWILLGKTITSPAVPLFTMLSGALVLAPDKFSDPVTVLKKRVLRLVVVFLFWSAIYAVYDPIRFSQPIEWKKAMMSFFSGYFHMWYLRMIIILYLGIPIFKMILANPKLTRWYLIVWMIFSVGLSTVKSNPYISKLATDVELYAYPDFFMGYSGYFLLGRYLLDRKWTRREKVTVLGLGAAGAALGYGMSYLLSQKLNDRVYILGTFDLPVFLLAISVFSAFLCFLPQNKTAHPILKRLSDCSLGTYLIHMIWLNGLYALFDFTPIAVWLRIPLVTGSCFLLSAATIWLLRLIPGFKRYCC